MKRIKKIINIKGETGIKNVSSFPLGRSFLMISASFLIAAVFAVPVIRLIIMGFQSEGGFTLSHYKKVLTSPRTWKVIKNTLIMVLGSGLIASFTGIVSAWLIAFSDIRFKRIIQLGIFLPFIIPSYVSSLAWVQFFGKNGDLERSVRLFLEGFKGFSLYSMGGIIIVLGLTSYPLVYLFTLTALRKIPREAELAARVSGAASLRTLKRVTLRMAMPVIAAGIFTAFLSCLDNFGIPAFLGSSATISVLTTYIYQEVTGFGTSAFSEAAVLSSVLGLIALTGLFIQWLILSGSKVTESQKEDTEPRIYLGRKRFVIEILIVGFFLMTNILPLFSLIVSPFYKVMGKPLGRENFTLENYRYIISSETTRQAFSVSVRRALVTSLITLICGVFIAYYRVRVNKRAGKIMESFITLPYALPGTVFALSMIFAWMQPLPGWNPGIYGSSAILYIAYFTRFLSLQVRSAAAGFEGIDISTEEASHISGTRGFAKWRKILIPFLLCHLSRDFF